MPDLDWHGNKWRVRARDKGTMARERLSTRAECSQPPRNDDGRIAVTRDPAARSRPRRKLSKIIQRSLSR